tara:strand:- start:222 stop:611 length:390 start_codon:yes stop_codon:yes gene_type:complete
VDPKPKPKQGQTQEDNEQEFAEQLSFKGFTLDSPEDSGMELTFEEGFNTGENLTSSAGVELGASYTGGFHTMTNEPTYLETSDNVVHAFTWAETKHKDMRKKYPALQKAYDHYKTLLALAQNGPEDLDN